MKCGLSRQVITEDSDLSRQVLLYVQIYTCTVHFCLYFTEYRPLYDILPLKTQLFWCVNKHFRNSTFSIFLKKFRDRKFPTFATLSLYPGSKSWCVWLPGTIDHRTRLPLNMTCSLICYLIGFEFLVAKDSQTWVRYELHNALFKIGVNWYLANMRNAGTVMYQYISTLWCAKALKYIGKVDLKSYR